MNLRIVFEPLADGGFMVSCPDPADHQLFSHTSSAGSGFSMGAGDEARLAGGGVGSGPALLRNMALSRKKLIRYKIF